MHCHTFIMIRDFIAISTHCRIKPNVCVNGMCGHAPTRADYNVMILLAPET